MNKFLLRLAIGLFVVFNISCTSSENKKIIGVWIPVTNEGYFDAIVFQKDGSVVTWNYDEEKEKRSDTNHYAYTNGILMIESKPIMVQSGENSNEIILSFEDHKYIPGSSTVYHRNNGGWGTPGRPATYRPTEGSVTLKKIAKKYNKNAVIEIIKNTHPAGIYTCIDQNNIDFYVEVNEDLTWRAAGYYPDSKRGFGFFMYNGSINDNEELVIKEGTFLPTKEWPVADGDTIFIPKGEVFALWGKERIKMPYYNLTCIKIE